MSKSDDKYNGHGGSYAVDPFTNERFALDRADMTDDQRKAAQARLADIEAKVKAERDAKPQAAAEAQVTVASAKAADKKGTR